MRLRALLCVSDGRRPELKFERALDRAERRRARSNGAGKKRARTRRAARGDGREHGLLTYPLEVQQTIFAQLDHESLDALTRTSRGLRTILLTPSSGRIVYRSVFAPLFASGLPKPPRGLSLPAYASLLSLKSCVCGKRVDHFKAYYSIVCFATRRRMCQECYRSGCVVGLGPPS